MNRLCNFLFERAAPQGTYVGAHFSDHSGMMLLNFCRKHKIPNPIERENFHVTVIYSESPLNNKFHPMGDIQPPRLAQPTGITVWQTADNNENRDENSDENSDERQNCLILQLRCPDLKVRHQQLVDEFEGHHSYPQFTPHVTLSYNIEDFNFKHLDENLEELNDLELINEYEEPLDVNWINNTLK